MPSPEAEAEVPPPRRRFLGLAPAIHRHVAVHGRLGGYICLQRHTLCHPELRSQVDQHPVVRVPARLLIIESSDPLNDT